MPSIKLKGAKAQEVKTGFEAYDGPTPTRKGFYRAVLKKLKYGLNANSGSYGFNIVLELEAAPGDPKGHGMFDGMPMFSRSIITEGKDGATLKEGAQRNLDNFLAALGTGDEPNVILEDGDIDEQVDVKKIGNRNPIGAVVNIDLGFETYNNEPRPTINGIYKLKDEAPGASKKATVSAAELADEEDADLFEGEAEEAEGDDEYAARSEELHALGIPALKNILKSDYDLPISGTKDVLVERILEHEFAEVEDDAEEPEDEEEAEDEVEGDEEEAEDEDEAEEDEAEEDEAQTARIEELAGFDRIALKKILKEVAPDFTVLKRHSDEELRDGIIEAEFGEELPF